MYFLCVCAVCDECLKALFSLKKIFGLPAIKICYTSLKSSYLLRGRM